MKQYKIYTKGNYIVIVDVQKNEYFYGIRKEVHIDKSNVNKAMYRAFNVKDFSSSIILAVPNILKEDGTPYSEAEFDTFYQENTGNFNGGGTAPEFIPLTGTTEDNPVSGNIEIIDGVSIIPEPLGGAYYLGDISKTALGITVDGITVASNYPLLSRGLTSEGDFTPNITDLDYTQKKYVDERGSVFNATTSVLSASDLNIAYPNAKDGFSVIAPNVIGGGKYYIKAGAGWVYQQILTVV